MAKSAEAFRTISEAANELDVPQHVLRHWEEVFVQVRPMRRAGGRRYYRPLDIDLLRGVRVLLYDQRYTTKGVQKIFKDEGVRYVSALGRRAAAGEPVDIRPVIADENPAEADAPKTNGATNATHAADPAIAAPALSPEAERVLKALLARLELVQEALDEATLALEAAAPDDAGGGFDEEA